MTSEQRLQIRTELAQRMGYSQRHTTHLLAAELAGDWLKPDGSFFDDAPPDPFTNAAASHATSAWLAADRDRMFDFCKSLKLKLGVSNGMFAYEVMERTLTAPLEAITLAACKALGI